MTIVRENPIRGNYSLIQSDKNWNNFPYLIDNFYLAHAQRVRVFYTISIFTGGEWNFQTCVYIDNKRYPIFNQFSVAKYQVTHTVQRDIWLEKGNHEVKVMYWTNGVFRNQLAN